MTAALGGVGQRMVTNTNGSALALDLVVPEYELFTNGDFNGDGNSDLVWDSVEYGTYVWNLGADGRIISAGQVAAQVVLGISSAVVSSTTQASAPACSGTTTKLVRLSSGS